MITQQQLADRRMMIQAAAERMQLVLLSRFDLESGLIDVRDNDGVQINNIQILNQNTNDPARVDCTVEDFMAGVDGDKC